MQEQNDPGTAGTGVNETMADQAIQADVQVEDKKDSNLQENERAMSAMKSAAKISDKKEPEQINQNESDLESGVNSHSTLEFQIKDSDEVKVMKESTLGEELGNVQQLEKSTQLEVAQSPQLESTPPIQSTKLETEFKQLEPLEVPPTSPTLNLTKSTGLYPTISVVPTGFDQQVSSTFLKEKFSIVAPGTKDSEGFLAPPPASTLLIRRARISSTGASTYVVSKSDSSPAIESDNIADDENNGSPILGEEGSVDETHVRRKPGRPVGSTCKYKKSSSTNSMEGQVQEPEVRVSSRSSSSIFKHDGFSPATSSFDDSSQWIYPSTFRPPHSSGGKPPMTNHQKPYSKSQQKKGIANIDPLTGKRRYTKRKKIGLEKKQKGVHFEVEHGRPKQHLSDNGVWRPTDDLRLIVNTTAVEDLEKVFIGVKFSCYFTYKEIEDRWRKLIYGEKSSLVAQNAITALHPQVKALIYSEALFSPEEEKLISSVKNVPLSNPDISSFQSLIDENLTVFNKHRTARSLMMHWLDMRDFHLLPDQDVMEYSSPLNFEDFEELVVDEDIQNEPIDEAIAQEIKNEDRNLKKKIRIVEDEITAWQLLIDQIMDDGRKDRTLPMLPTEFDNKTFAILRGLQVLYVMTSREITLGRSTKECKVDADLTQEGSSNRISRKQAIIKLKDMGKFVIINKGRHAIFVDRKAVPYKSATLLHDQSVIQIAHISLIFLINESLIEKLIDRDVRREVYASFKDLETDLPPAPLKSDPFPAYKMGSPGSLYSNSTTPQSRSKIISTHGESSQNSNWGYHYFGGKNEISSSITSPGSAARTNSIDTTRNNLAPGLQASGNSGYQSGKYAVIPSFSKNQITAGVSSVKHKTEPETNVPEVFSVTGTTGTGNSHWESPVSSLSQCSIGQMSGSVSSAATLHNYSEELKK